LRLYSLLQLASNPRDRQPTSTAHSTGSFIPLTSDVCVLTIVSSDLAYFLYYYVGSSPSAAAMIGFEVSSLITAGESEGMP
jgi:hypothetical protein